jgi:hypothetical protein
VAPNTEKAGPAVARGHPEASERAANDKVPFWPRNPNGRARGLASADDLFDGGCL